MSLSEIGFSLNSTLFDDNFEPLDKIIKSQRSLVASDEAYYTVVYKNSGLHSGGETIDVAEITMNCNGSLRCAVDGNASSNICNVIIKKNDTQILSVTAPSQRGIAYGDFSFSEGDVLTISYRTTGIASVYGIYLQGSIIDNSLLDVRIIE